MKTIKLDEILELGSFLKELAEEGEVRLGFAKELGTKLSQVMAHLHNLT